MSGQAAGHSTRHGLAFLALLAFVASFVLARTFTTLFPSTVVITGGIHFHHFWYGLFMIVLSGWLGISGDDPRYRRAYALLFGFGGGLVGDETGLLLTLGNYHSDLTYFAVTLIIAVSLLLILLTTRRRELEYDVFSLERWEGLVYLGLAIGGASSLPLAAGFLLPGGALLALGAAVTATALWSHRKG